MPQLAIPVVAETAVASTMTAAEIAAAEAAAQAAAEAAAAEAAQQAAMQAAAEQAAQQAAAQAAAEQAAQQTAAQAAAQQASAQAATQASTSGIQTLAQEVGAGAQSTGTGLDQLTQAFQQAQANNVPMSQAEFLNNSFAGPPVQASSTFSPGTSYQDIVNREFINQPVPSPSELSPITSEVVSSAAPPAAPPAAETPVVDTRFPPASTPPPNTPADVTYGAGQSRITTNPADLLNQPTAASNITSGIQRVFNNALAYAEKNPLQTGYGAMSLYSLLNRPKPYEKPKYKSTFDASAYRPYEPTPPTPYRPQYAQGGVLEVGNPGTQLQDNADPLAFQSTGVERMAAGGISNLGAYSDYARGGRMLKGPGDGMSDDIPATIANKQPARLANEEFVIPADVVSHLGNGSSEAGAKQLYKMMDRVRQARTGTKKQGKQIKPEKYLA